MPHLQVRCIASGPDAICTVRCVIAILRLLHVDTNFCLRIRALRFVITSAPCQVV
jgi:hypothetical protein